MKREGVAKAERRLAEAEHYLASMKRAVHPATVHSFRNSWYHFLVAITSVFEILRSTAKGDRSDDPWFGQYVSEAAKDPLLRYVKQARGVEYHGVEESSIARLGAAEVIGTLTGIATLLTKDGKSIKQQLVGPVVADDPGFVDNATLEFRHDLQDVQDHRGNIFPVPTSHLGDALEGSGPVLVAEKAFEYHRRLVALAWERIG